MTGDGPPSFADASSRAANRPAFGNGHEGETWMGAWCGTCVFGEGGDGCALAVIALLGETPAEWVGRVPTGLVTRYECTVYRPERADRDVRVYAATMPAWQKAVAVPPGEHLNCAHDPQATGARTCP